MVKYIPIINAGFVFGVSMKRALKSVNECNARTSDDRTGLIVRMLAAS